MVIPTGCTVSKAFVGMPFKRWAAELTTELGQEGLTPKEADQSARQVLARLLARPTSWPRAAAIYRSETWKRELAAELVQGAGRQPTAAHVAATCALKRILVRTVNWPDAVYANGDPESEEDPELVTVADSRPSFSVSEAMGRG